MFKDLIGMRQGKLVVTEELPREEWPNGRTKRSFLCQCDCGVVGYFISAGNLRSGAIQHCGCDSPRHGGHGTKLYGVWRGMMQRCYDTNYQAFHNYGARGIEVCAEWHEFAPFRRWAMESGYGEGLSIERENNDGPYAPDNCVWIPLAKQAANRRTTVWVEHDGERMTASEFARRSGIGVTSVLYRARNGLPLTGVRNAVQKQS